MLPASKHRGNLSVWLSLTIKEFSPIINLPNQCLILNLKKTKKNKKKQQQKKNITNSATLKF